MRAVEPGLYRNPPGARLQVLNYVQARERYGVLYLGPGGYIAESHSELFGTTLYVVTAESLAECGYEKEGSND